MLVNDLLKGKWAMKICCNYPSIICIILKKAFTPMVNFYLSAGCSGKQGRKKEHKFVILLSHLEMLICFECFLHCGPRLAPAGSKRDSKIVRPQLAVTPHTKWFVTVYLLYPFS